MKKLTSNEINEIIANWEGRDDMPYECFGGKAIPYIGWYWREVDFDDDYCWFGIMPPYENLLERNEVARVCFMQNNKWNYPELKISGIDWKNLKNLIEVAVIEPTYDNLKAVDDAMQVLLPK
jgi:hypothetical protein